MPVSIAIILLWQVLMFADSWATDKSIPLTNSSQAIAFTSIVLTAGSLWLSVRRQWLLCSVTVTMSGFAALVSWLAKPDGGASSHVAPVLSSPWLAVHVSLIMTAYALLTIIFAVAIVAIIHPSEKLRILSLSILYPALLLLAAGIFAGAVWADRAWGRYWAWDPKETWALITLIVYSLPLHIPMPGRRRLPVFLCFAFLTVIITFWGVNYLPSIHAYR